jgi:hypothetical protein
MRKNIFIVSLAKTIKNLEATLEIYKMFIYEGIH